MVNRVGTRKISITFFWNYVLFLGFFCSLVFKIEKNIILKVCMGIHSFVHNEQMKQMINFKIVLNMTRKCRT